MVKGARLKDLVAQAFMGSSPIPRTKTRPVCGSLSLEETDLTRKMRLSQDLNVLVPRCNRGICCVAWGTKSMNVRTLAFVYVLFGLFFLVCGISLVGISSTLDDTLTYMSRLHSPVFYLAVVGVGLSLGSLFFIVFTLHYFRDVFFGEKPAISSQPSFAPQVWMEMVENRTEVFVKSSTQASDRNESHREGSSSSDSFG